MVWYSIVLYCIVLYCVVLYSSGSPGVDPSDPPLVPRHGDQRAATADGHVAVLWIRIYIYIYMYTNIHTYIHIYIYRERERELRICIHIYIYIYIYIRTCGNSDCGWRAKKVGAHSSRDWLER